MLCPNIPARQRHVSARVDAPRPVSVPRIIACLALALGLAGSFSVHAQTTFEDGTLEVTTSPEYGFPGVSFDSTPLWSIDSPSTSRAFLRIDDTVVELRDDSQRVFAEVIDSSDAFVQQWETSGVHAELTIERIHTVDTVVLDEDGEVVGLRVNMRLSNERDQPAALGVRYIIDTWFGERNHAHFYTAAPDDTDASARAGREDSRRSPDDARESGETQASGEAAESGETQASGEAISVERTLSTRNRYLDSVGPRGALRLMLSEGSSPDQVGVANIRRLREAAWFHNTGRARGFSLRPFSVNDSALQIVFDTVTVEPDGERSVELVFLVAEARDDIASALAPEPESVAQEEQDEPSEDETREGEGRESDPSSEADTESDATDSEENGVTTREEAIEELDQALRRLQEISEGERQPEPGELEEIQQTIERLRDLRDTL